MRPRPVRPLGDGRLRSPCRRCRCRARRIAAARPALCRPGHRRRARPHGIRTGVRSNPQQQRGGHCGDGRGVRRACRCDRNGRRRSSRAFAVGVLPGNPSSAFVALQELIRPVALALAGRRDPLLPRVIARLEGTTRAKPALTYASYAQVRVAEHNFVVRPLINKCSALTRAASVADGFIVVPPGSATFATGAQLDVDVFDWTAVATGQSQTPVSPRGFGPSGRGANVWTKTGSTWRSASS